MQINNISHIQKRYNKSQAAPKKGPKSRCIPSVPFESKDRMRRQANAPTAVRAFQLPTLLPANDAGAHSGRRGAINGHKPRSMPVKARVLSLPISTQPPPSAVSRSSPPCELPMVNCRMWGSPQHPHSPPPCPRPKYAEVKLERARPGPRATVRATHVAP